MAKTEKNVCPGCSRHCSIDNIRCKYGRRYFEKMQEKQTAQIPSYDKTRHYKWEKLVDQNGLVWKFLWTGSQIKRALRKKKITEKQLLSALDETERLQLNTLLQKVAEPLK